MGRRPDATVEQLIVGVYKIPTGEPESDGTLEWASTTAVVVEAHGGGRVGLGWAYGHAAAAAVARDDLAPLVTGRDVLDVPGAWDAMVAALRNAGRPGIGSTAVSAVDTALWDLKARVLDVALVDLLGARRDAVPLYGSGGFTSLSVEALCGQLRRWVDDGLPAVKLKVGRDPGADPARVAAAREAVGPDVTLMVDANGAYDHRVALAAAERFAEVGVTWFEEPVSSDDLAGLALVRGRTPAGVEVAAGEYGYDVWYFDRMVGAGAVDVAQPDATRCGGYTAFSEIAARCRASHVPVSAHTAPQLHAHVCASVPALRHVEWFHDHVLVERLLFDGVLEPVDGTLQPDRGRPGNGLALRRADAERYAT